MRVENEFLDLLEEIRTIAQNGLHFTKDTYDKARYSRLLEIASMEYSKIYHIDKGFIYERFKNELGYITPKVGVNGVVFNEDGQILLEKRADDHKWGIPGGWAEVGESPEESVQREVFEETGLNVEAKAIVHVFSRLPSYYGKPHTTYHLLYYCKKISGELRMSSESIDIGYHDIKKVSQWHQDHKSMAEKAYWFYCCKKY